MKILITISWTCLSIQLQKVTACCWKHLDIAHGPRYGSIPYGIKKGPPNHPSVLCLPVVSAPPMTIMTECALSSTF